MEHLKSLVRGRVCASPKLFTWGVYFFFNYQEYNYDSVVKTDIIIQADIITFSMNSKMRYQKESVFFKIVYEYCKMSVIKNTSIALRTAKDILMKFDIVKVIII